VGKAVMVAAAALVAGCHDWHCDFWSHGACVEFSWDTRDIPGLQERVDALLERELPFWGLSQVSGWRVQFRTSQDHTCYFSTRDDGCTDYLEQTISVRVPTDALGCPEAAELLHELGHYALGDPMHVNDAWKGVPDQFAPIVWDRPDAPEACVDRYGGVRTGVWTVRTNSF
jgi:hypothetical protein